MFGFTAKKIKKTCMRSGLSQDEAANYMKINKRAISQIKAD